MSTWASQIYVATQGAGVFHTSDFVSPSTQPVWQAVNDGLPALDVLDFAGNIDVQYALLSTSRNLYRRMGGTWQLILSPGIVDFILETSGSTVHNVTVDKSNPARVLTTVGSPGVFGDANGWYVLISDDYGANWIACNKVFNSGFTYGMGGMVAYGHIIALSCSRDAGGIGSGTTISWNGGNAWVHYSNLGYNTIMPIQLNALNSKIYCLRDILGNIDLAEISNGAGLVTLQDGLGFNDPPFSGDMRMMWFHSTVADTQRLIRNQRLYATDDGWETYSDLGALSYGANRIGIDSSRDSNQMLLGLNLTSQDHLIGAIEVDTMTMYQIAGAHPDTGVDSIPNTCGKLSRNGILGIIEPLAGFVYTRGVVYA